MNVTQALARVNLLPVSAAQKRAIKTVISKLCALQEKVNVASAELDAQLLEVSKEVIHVDKSMMALEGRLRTTVTPPATLRWALLVSPSDSMVRDLVPKDKTPSEAVAHLVKTRADLLRELRSVNRKLKEIK